MRIRQAASQIEGLRDRYDADRRGINEAVDELLSVWHGDTSIAFEAKWHGGTGAPAPANVLADVTHTLDQFAKQLYDYADRLEHAQHDHWIQIAVLAAMTVVNVAQMGLDGATDAVEVGVAATDAVSSAFDLANVATLATKGAFAAFASDLAGQVGADVWDRADSGFDRTGDHVVAPFDPVELALDTATGGATGSLIGFGGQLVRIARRTTVEPPTSPTAQQIAAGHAFGKHVVGLREFPEVTGRGPEARQQFAQIVERVMNSADNKPLAGGRHAYWEDASHTLVIVNASAADGGTCFRPRLGRSYYERLS